MSHGGKHYIPRPDGDFDAWRKNFTQYVTTWFFQLGLTEEQVTTMTAAAVQWGKDYAAHNTAQAAAEAARTKKDAARAAFEQVIRPMVRIAQAHPGTTDAARAAMGIAGRGAAGGQAAPPTTRPLMSVMWGGRFTHDLRLADSGTPTRRARPRGAAAAQVWRALAPADAPTPADPEAFEFMGLLTRSTMRASFRAEDKGKQAAYLARWMSPRGEEGPWSDVATAIVAA